MDTRNLVDRFRQFVLKKPKSMQEFQWNKNDPLAAEHAAISAWSTAALATPNRWCHGVELKSLPAGQAILDAKPPEACRLVRAAFQQSQHWSQQLHTLRSSLNREMDRINVHLNADWEPMQKRFGYVASVIVALLRRTLPFKESDWVEILRSSVVGDFAATFSYPFSSMARGLERFASQNPLDDELRSAISNVAQRLAAANSPDLNKIAVKLSRLVGTSPDESTPDSAPAERRPSPSPALAGSPNVLCSLKQYLGLMQRDVEVAVSQIDFDQFPLLADSPLAEEHHLLTPVLEEGVSKGDYYGSDFHKLDTFQKLSCRSPVENGRLLLAAAERQANALLNPWTDINPRHVWQARAVTGGVALSLLTNPLEFSRDGLFDYLLFLSTVRKSELARARPYMSKLFDQVQREFEAAPLTDGERYALHLLRNAIIPGAPLGVPSADVSRLTGFIGDGVVFVLAPGEVWSEALNASVTELPASERDAWIALVSHAITATSARPSAKWLKTAKSLVDAVGADKVQQALADCLPLVSRGRAAKQVGQYIGDSRGAADTMIDDNANSLRGLLWLVQLLPSPNDLAREVASVAISAYKKVPGVGPRATKVGNAAVYALSELGTPEAVGQLAKLKVRVKFGTAQKEIEKAFTVTAEALALPRDQIEEMGVPSYGLEEVGRHSETLGDYRAELLVTGSDAELRWLDPNGKALKSVPAKVKADHAEDLKELKQSLKDIESMLPAQRDRIDSMFLLQKSWPIEPWRERYINHPLVGTIARRLIWCVDGTPAVFADGNPTDVTGQPIEHGKTAEVTLWHPVGRPIDEITAWRRRLEELEITQPFKQAHREIYVLTDAERNTNTYSNRFAAHIIRQHQFNALCAARGWKNQLRLMVDDSYYPPAKTLPEWGLRAEFWVEGVGDNYNVDTNETGTYLRLATDQVRFYRSGAANQSAHAGGGGYSSNATGPGENNINEPLPLDQVPSLVFSEIMRDVDLFVGVASVGNDPTWQDGGPAGRYREYWQTFSFGELSGSAVTRKQVLERLVPRLKIADRCSFSDRFLVVRGQKRTYKIHLGSGNILMEPNDEYLCIVPNASLRATQNDLFLPFEGDSTLSIIISKALMLADDTKIKDATITRQINRV